jgi:hypothetical protein
LTNGSFFSLAAILAKKLALATSLR